MEHSKYYKYAETTLKSLNNDPNKLLSIYGVQEEDTLLERYLNAVRGFLTRRIETAVISSITGKTK